MANAEDLNAAQEAPWVATLRRNGLPTSIDEALQNSVNAFTWPTRVAKAFANNPQAQEKVGGALDYIRGTDPAAAGEAVDRLLRPVHYAGKDIDSGTFVDNVRYRAGSAAMIPSDVIGGLLRTPEFVSDVSGSTGGPTLPKSVTDTLGGWAQDVRTFSEPWADWLAGRQVNDTMLRGTPADMSAGMGRTLIGGAAPIPGGVTTPITSRIQQGVAKLTGGSQLARTATDAAGRTLEVLSPLSIAPTPGVVAANAAVTGVMGPGGEAYGESQRIKKEQEQADAVAKQGEATAIQGGQEAGVVKTPVPFGNVSSDVVTGISDHTADVLGKEIGRQNVVKAGLPSTGSTEDDLKVAAAVTTGFLMLRYRRRIGELVSNAIDRVPPVSRKLGGYDPSVPADATQTSLRTRMGQQRTDAQQSLGDQTKKALMETGVSKQQAEDFTGLRREDIARSHGASLYHRIGVFNQDGKWLDSTAQSRMPWNEYTIRRNQLSPEDLVDLNKLYHFTQEVDTRVRLAGLNVTHGRPNTHVNNYGYNFYDTPTADLSREIQRIRNTKPDVVSLADAWYDHVRQGTKYGIERWSLEPNEGSRFLRNNPHYVPPTNLPDGASLFNNYDVVRNWNAGAGRDIPRGVRTLEELGDPYKTQQRYIHEMFSRTESNGNKRAFMQDMRTLAGIGSKTARDMFGRPGPLQGAQDRVVKWRDQYGKKQSVEINDAVVRDAFKGLGNPTQLQMINAAMQQSTRMFQSGAVGPMSLFNPTFFPVDSIFYQTMSGSSFTKPHGVAMSASDLLARKLGSKSASGIPGDPSFAALSFGQAGLNMGSVIIDRLARGFHNSVINSGMLTKLMSPKAVQTMADWTSDLYRKTGLYHMQEQGLMGPGMASNKALDYNARTGAGGTTVTGAIAGGIGKVVSGVAGQPVHMPGMVKNAQGKWMSGYNFVDDIMHAISAGPSVVILKMNKNLPPGEQWKAASAARNLSGDPGKAGAFRGAPLEKNAILGSPFGNPAYQAFGRLAESFIENPGRLATGIFMTAVLPGSMSSMWNASNGSEYTQYEFLTRTPERQASHIYLARPGYPPEEGWEYPVEPVFRPFMWAGKYISGMMFGLLNGEIHKEENSDMKSAIDELVWNSQEFGLDKGKVTRAVTDQTALLPVHPIVGAASALTGKRLGSYLDLGDPKSVIENKQAGFIEGTQADPAKQKLFGMNMPAWVGEVIGAVGATGYQSAWNMLTGISADMTGDPDRGVQPKSLKEAFGYQMEGWTEKASRTTVGQLFGTHRVVTPSQEASAHVVKQKMDTITEVTDAYRATINKGSEKWFGTKKTGKEEPEGVKPRGPQDEMTLAFAKDLSSIRQRMSPYLEQIKLAHNQRMSIQQDSRISAAEKTQRMEDQAYRVIDANRRMLQDLQRFEAVLTVKYRMPVSFENYNKDVPLSQQNWKPRWMNQAGGPK